MLAGYAWKWVSKGKADRSVTDIEIEGARLRWNVRQENWVGMGIGDPDVAREVGCIHAIQGYDLRCSRHQSVGSNSDLSI